MIWTFPFLEEAGGKLKANFKIRFKVSILLIVAIGDIFDTPVTLFSIPFFFSSK